MGKHAERLPPRTRLLVAWACLSQPQAVSQASYWLKRAVPAGPLERAWKHRLSGEYHKIATGRDYSKDRALEEMEAAVKVFDSVRPPEIPEAVWRRQQRIYEQDRAWVLQYLFYEHRRALETYERLIVELEREAEPVSGAEHDLSLAALLRNRAACEAEIHESSWDGLLLAGETLHRAEQILERHRGAHLRAEVFYDQSKLAEARYRLGVIQHRQQSDVARAERDATRLLRSCLEAAEESHHVLMTAVAGPELLALRRLPSRSLGGGRGGASELLRTCLAAPDPHHRSAQGRTRARATEPQR